MASATGIYSVSHYFHAILSCDEDHRTTPRCSSSPWTRFLFWISWNKIQPPSFLELGTVSRLFALALSIAKPRSTYPSKADPAP